MSRNFDHESFVNFLLRAMRAAKGRLRGKFWGWLGAFAKGSSRKLFFGRGLRLINSKAILLHDNVSFGELARIECHRLAVASTDGGPLIVIGKKTSFGDYFHAGAVTGIKIGENVLGGSNILILDHNHGSPSRDMREKTQIPPRDRELSSRAGIVIEDNVWIGDNAIILQGAQIGFGAIIAANSIIRGTVKPHTIASGDVGGVSANDD